MDDGRVALERHRSTDDEHLITFYSEGSFERDRLALGRGRLEFERTRELLGRYLPDPPARVLDVGGGAGAHASWLAKDGYEVELVDLVPALVDQARQASDSQPEHSFRARVGDARSLDFADGSADVVLLLGPLYHLPEARDRAQALAEAKRVLRPGGAVAAASINRWVPLLDAVRGGKLDEAGLERLTNVAETGQNDPAYGFTTAYFHRPEELARELADAGFEDVQVLAVEGPGWMFLRTGSREGSQDTPAVEESLLAAAVSLARATETVPELLGASAHLLAIGRS